MKQINQEQIEEIKVLLKNRQNLRATKILDGLEDVKITNLIDFLIELKRKVGNSGRTNIITVREIEELFVRYEINLGELNKLKNDS